MLMKPGCHLCDEARVVIEATRDTLAPRIHSVFEEVNILEDPELARRYAEDIPVVFVAGRQHAIWRVSSERLTQALEKAAKPNLFGRTRRKEAP